MEENSAFRLRMAERARGAKLQAMAEQYEEQSSLLKKRAEVIRDLLMKNAIRDGGAGLEGKPVKRGGKAAPRKGRPRSR